MVMALLLLQERMRIIECVTEEISAGGFFYCVVLCCCLFAAFTTPCLQ
jgi:hypothetical protein